MKSHLWNDLWTSGQSETKWLRPEPFLRQLIPNLRRDGVKRVLDLGCGIGRHAVFLGKNGFKVSAIDSSWRAVRFSREWLDRSDCRAEVCLSDVTYLPFPRDYFDFVLSWNVVYHSSRKGIANALKEIERVLRPDGYLLLTLNSTRNSDCGFGIEVEPNTFDNPKKIDGKHLHHYSDKKDVRSLLERFRIKLLKESEQGPEDAPIPGSFHWTILARASL
jgi:SAM-dependent methyltransferase